MDNNSLRNAERGFDSLAPRYDSLFGQGLKGILTRRKIREVLLVVSPKEGEVVLEIGPGSGLYTVELLKAGAEVACLDISQKMLDETRKKVESLGYTSSYHKGHILDLPFENGTFDKVVAIAVLPSVEPKNLIPQAIEEMLRVVKEKGEVTFDLPRYHPLRLLYTKLYLKLKPYTKESTKIKTHLFTNKEVIDIVFRNTSILIKRIAWGIYYLVKVGKP